MKIRIDGRELRVVKTTRVLVEWQHQSGHEMAWLATDEGKVYGLAFSAFCALQNAGFEPNWDKLLDVDTGEWEFIEEPGDKRAAGDAPVPLNSLADSSADSDGGEHVRSAPAQAKQESKHSSKPKGSSKTR